MDDLYRLVYTSRNFLQGPEAEAAEAVAQILETSRRNNAKADVSGALMFNGGAFAQVLEGPRRGVEATFERIQRDARHGEVTVLQCGPVAARGFAHWSMGYVGRSARGQALWSGLAAQSGFDLSRMDGDAVFAMLHGLILEEENLGAPAAAPELRPRGEVARLVPQEIDRPVPVRAEPAPAPAEVAPAARGDAVLALVVLKAALASERERTTALRAEADEARVALAIGREALRAAEEARDLWAARTHQLAAMLGQEAETAGAARARSAA